MQMSFHFRLMTNTYIHSYKCIDYVLVPWSNGHLFSAVSSIFAKCPLACLHRCCKTDISTIKNFKIQYDKSCSLGYNLDRGAKHVYGRQDARIIAVGLIAQ